MKKSGGAPGPAAKSEPFCRCEATIAGVILEGYACGNPTCWRTPVVQASFDAFVTDLVRARGMPRAADPETANDH